MHGLVKLVFFIMKMGFQTHDGIRLHPLPADHREGILFLLAAIARTAALGFLVAFPQRAFVAGDGEDYWALSHALLHSRSLSFPTPDLLQTAFTRTPGYPLFLAAIRMACPLSETAEIIAVGIVQSLLSLWMILLIYRLARKAWEDAAPGCLLPVFALFALDPGFAVFGCLIMTEILFGFLWVLSAVFLFNAFQECHHSRKRYGSAMAASLILALATLVRPIGQFMILPMALAIAWVFSKIRDGRSALIISFLSLGLFCLPLLLWAGRNWALGGPFTLSSVPSVNLLLYAEELEHPEQSGDEVWASVKTTAAQIQMETETTAEWYRRMGKQGKGRLLARPGDLLKAIFHGCLETAIAPPYAMFRFWGWTDEEIAPVSSVSEITEGFRNQPFQTALRICLMAEATILILLAAFFVLTSKRVWCDPWLLTVLCWTGMHTLLSALSGGGRMRIPVMAWIILFASGFCISGFRLKADWCKEG